ncbi:prepilin-type N-terminal cleavage/methylation domain-containing protein [Candidatus Parcubacteria bacterium]|nr:prepilin-type N-terminal cleavage/methylation domain-containing protein [Candidatus Parcubacteria bacterium]
MHKTKGFTLIELLVVIAIIGILSSVVLASLNTARTKARDARRLSDIKQMQLALEMYYDDNGGYPVYATYATLVAGNDLPAGGYLATMPVDPGSNNFGYIGTASTYCLSTATEGPAPVPGLACPAEATVPAAIYSVEP